MTELICITCPKGCHLIVNEKDNYQVSGNLCKRGIEYGKNELLHPMRIVTSTVRLEGTARRRLPVKTDKPIPKALIFSVMKLIDALAVQSPIQAGDIIISNILNTDANIVATKGM